MRKSEIAALRLQNIDLENGTNSISSAMQKQDKQLILKDTKTNKSRRVIPIPQQAVEHLRMVMQQQAINRENLGEAYDKRGFA